MEILKNLSSSELEKMRKDFVDNTKGAIKEEEFISILAGVCLSKPKLAFLTKEQLSRLFASIDVTGSGYVSWEEFSMFAIEQAQFSMESVTAEPNSVATKDAEDGTVDTFITFRPYHIESTVQHPFGTTITDLRSIPRARKLVQVHHDTKGNSQVTLMDLNESQSVYAKLPKVNEVVTSWEYVPSTSGVSSSNCLLFSYNGGTVTQYPLEKRHTYDEVLLASKSMLFSETQTALVWSSMYGKLILGSRRGILSVWDIDSKTVGAQEKIHQNSVTSMKVRSSLLFSSSLDRVNSVKGVDLEHSVVRFAFNDHMVGGSTCLELDEEFLFSAGFEGKLIQRTLQNPKGSPTILFDTNDPHQGRVTALERKVDTPLLMSGDSKGIVKVWDLRMGSCVQTIYPTPSATAEAKRYVNSKQDGSRSNRSKRNDGESSTGNDFGLKSALEAAVDATCVNAICQLPLSDLLIVVNRIESVTLTSSETTFPDLSDDACACRYMLMPDEERIITVHDKGVKFWSLVNGHLLYATSNNLLSSDVSSCAMLEPLNRQFLLASMEGELKAFSVALGKQMVDFSELLMETPIWGKEILSLDTVAQYRDYTIPYVIVAQSDAVYIFPFSKDTATNNVVRMSTVHSVLTENKTSILSTHLVNCRWLFVSFANASLSLFDITRMSCLVVTYSLPSGGELESLHISLFHPPVSEVSPQSGGARGKGEDTTNHLLAFAADQDGVLCVEEAISNASASEVESVSSGVFPTTNKDVFNIIGEWTATQRDGASWKWTKSKRFVTRGWDPIASKEENNVGIKRIPCAVCWDGPRRCEGVGRRWGHQTWREAEREAGGPSGARTTATYPPVLIKEWHAHKAGFTAWKGFLHPLTGLPALLTGGADRKVVIWSADGESLGTLSAGRQLDDRTGGKRFGLDPFCPPSGISESLQWPLFVDYIRNRVEKLRVEDTTAPTFTSPKDVTMTLGRLEETTVGEDNPPSPFFVTENPSRVPKEDQDLLGALILSSSSSSSVDSQDRNKRTSSIMKRAYSTKANRKKSQANLSRTGATMKDMLPPIATKRETNFYNLDRASGLLPPPKEKKVKENENYRSRSTNERNKRVKTVKRRVSLSAPPTVPVPRQYQIESLLPRL